MAAPDRCTCCSAELTRLLSVPEPLYEGLDFHDPLLENGYEPVTGKLNLLRCYLVVMNGPPGVGKTRCATMVTQKFKSLFSSLTVFRANPDQYCKTTGISGMGKARQRVQKDLLDAIAYAKKSQSGNVHHRFLVIIDTCNGFASAKDAVGIASKGYTSESFFGLDFSKWNRCLCTPNLRTGKTSEWLEWSCEKLLQRNACDATSDYLLNPINSDLSMCLRVHQKKAEYLGVDCEETIRRKSSSAYAQGIVSPRETMLAQLFPTADEYQKMLTEERVMERQIQGMVCHFLQIDR